MCDKSSDNIRRACVVENVHEQAMSVEVCTPATPYNALGHPCLVSLLLWHPCIPNYLIHRICLLSFFLPHSHAWLVKTFLGIMPIKKRMSGLIFLLPDTCFFTCF